MAEEFKTAEAFKGNPFMQAIAKSVDEALQTGDTISVDERFLKLAELFELRTANMLAFQGGDKLPTKKEFKDEIRDRVAAEKPSPGRVSRVL